MTRIANLAASDDLLQMLARTRRQVQDLQTQVATGKRSQTYAGIAGATPASCWVWKKAGRCSTGSIATTIS